VRQPPRAIANVLDDRVLLNHGKTAVFEGVGALTT
jgi:hypothetical protein